MTTPSYTRLFLENWGVSINDIPTSEKEESDFLASFGTCKVLIEEKTKLDNPARVSERAEALAKGKVHGSSIPIMRDNRLSGIVSKAARRLSENSTDELPLPNSLPSS